MSTEDISPTKILWAVLGLVGTIGLALGGFLCQRTISHDAQIAAIQYQIQSVIQIQTNTIPPVIEQSLREIREKGNSQTELLSRLAESSSRNTQEVGYLKEAIAKMKP